VAASRAARTPSSEDVHASWIDAPTVAAPEAGHVLKAPDDVIRAHGAKQKDIQGQGGGAHGSLFRRMNPRPGFDGALLETVAPGARRRAECRDTVVPLIGWACGPFAMGDVRGSSGHTIPVHRVFLSTKP
jgi:hypothetical protein